ncbi:hypothetical protein AGMMS49556_09640 [Endomicrobiia bacterium]|nr:hypothetical protein AGMMS49556_09640 [Endomicrobiia bacterium]
MSLNLLSKYEVWPPAPNVQSAYKPSGLLIKYCDISKGIIGI